MIIIQILPTAFMIFMIVVSVLFAMVICDIAEKEIGEKDPSSVMPNEFVAVSICFLGAMHFVPAEIAI
jgi:phosphatidylglycerophosphatase A